MSCGDTRHGEGPNRPETPTAASASSPEPQLGTKSPSPPAAPPPPPNPASDPRLRVSGRERPRTTSGGSLATNLSPSGSPTSVRHAPPPSSLSEDIFAVPPSAAVRLLGASIEALVRLTPDIPPAALPDNLETPNMRGMEVEKQAIKRSHSERTLQRLRKEAEAAAALAAQAPLGSQTASPGASTYSPPAPPATTQIPAALASSAHTLGGSIDGVRLRSPSPTPRACPPSTPEPFTVIGEHSQPVNIQHSAITRKFYSKKAPSISIGDYLLRLHTYCPSSTAVYLATSLYLYRLAIDQGSIVVTRRNAHRLLLAALRVANKALEDRCYPHALVAEVGGVSKAELARLEISFCFLSGFELVVTRAQMEKHWAVMRTPPRELAIVGGLGGTSSAGAAALGEHQQQQQQQQQHQQKPPGGDGEERTADTAVTGTDEYDALEMSSTASNPKRSL